MFPLKQTNGADHNLFNLIWQESLEDNIILPTVAFCSMASWIWECGTWQYIIKLKLQNQVVKAMMNLKLSRLPDRTYWR